MFFKNPIAAVSFGVLASCLLAGQAQAQLSITNYKFVSEDRVTRTQSNVTYTADLVNTGPPITSAVATLSTSVPNITVVPTAKTLSFGAVPTGGQVASNNSFTILVDRTVPFNFSDLIWSIQANVPAPPVANAGPNQTATVGSTVTLNGSGSSNPSGIGTLTYSWALTQRPAGSNATLVNPTSVNPTFVVDAPGNYVITLTVSNGTASSTSSVTVSTINTKPVANPGPNQTVNIGSTVVLNGSGSSDVDGDPLTYAWTLTQKPTGSSAVLSGANTVNPTFVADRRGTYTVQLIVNDGKENSDAKSVTITVQGNTQPTANAGPPQTVNVGSLVQLNGSASTDVDGDPLTYKWSLITVPAGSTATLSSTTIVNPTFTADKPGTYVAQLIVNDGTVDSAPAMVTITTNAPNAPTANAGPNQTVRPNTVVTLNGSGTDPQNLPLTFQWSLITKPAGSTAALSSATIANPTFTADLPGDYVAQLIVNNGTLNSAPSTVTINTKETPPVANPGPNQTVQVGATVTLNGSASSDVDNDPLTYAWSFTSRPAGSNATLTNANTVSANFVADVAGTYVVQLIVNDGFANSPPATVTITATTGSTIALTPNPLNLTTSPGTLTVTLSAPAGQGGQVVNLSSSNSGVASVPASVTIAAGSTGANVTVTPGTQGTATITGSASGFTSGTTTVNVAAAPTISFTPTSITITGTATQNLTLNLSSPAPSGGLTINLSSDDILVATVPATATFAAGATSAAVPVTGVSAGTTVIRASAPGITGTTANVTVASPGSITLAGGVTVGVGQSAPIAVTLTTPAPAGGVTVTLTSLNPAIAAVTGTVDVPAGATTPATQPQVTGINIGSVSITATAPGYSTASQTVQVNVSPVFTPNTLTITATTAQNLTLTLPAPAPTGGVTVNLSSSNTGAATVPGSVTFASGATSVSVPVTGVAPGSAIITASGPNVVQATANVTVVAPGSITIPTGLNVGLGLSVPFPITLSTPAPAGGVTVTLTGDASIVTLTSPVVVPAGATSPTTQPQITGVGLGSATVTATAPGYSPASQTVQVNATLVFSPPSLAITGTATQNLTLTLSAPAPAAGVTVNVKSDSPGVATVPATVGFAAGATTATVPVTGVGAGATVIRASAANVAEATANVTVSQGTITLPPGVTVPVGGSVPFPIALSVAAPPGGVTVTLNSTAPTVVTVTQSAFVPAGATAPTTQPTVTGVSAGTANITASAPGYNPTAVPVTGGVLPNAIAVASVAVGQNLQAPVLIQFPQPVPAGGTTLTVTSADPTRLLVAPGSTFTGSNSITLQIPEGSTGTTVVAQALAGSGTVALNASASGYSPGSGTISLTPSGFVFAGANGPVGSFSSDQGVATPIPVSAARLDSSMNFVAVQQVRTGFSVSVSMNSSNPGVGTITPTLTFDGPADTLQASFTAVSPGSTTLTVVPPSGFSTPAQNASVSAQVNPTTMSIQQTDPVVGQNLETDAFVFLAGTAPSQGLTVSISSSDPSKLLLSKDPTTAGTQTIEFVIQGGGSRTPTFYVQALANSGTATYTATASGFGTATQTVTFGPSGFVIASPLGLGQDFSTSPGGADAPLTVFAELLNSSNNFVATQRVRGGLSVGVPVTSANTSVGTITVSPVTVSGGSTTGVTAFHPVANGSTLITAGVPAGFATPASSRTLTATVGTPTFSITDGVTIGQNLEIAGLISLSQPAPAGGLQVTLTSANASLLLISDSATTAGSGTKIITIPAGASEGQYFLQALGSSGTVTYNGSAPGYSSPPAATVTLVPSGLSLTAASGGSFETNVGSPAPLLLRTVRLSAGSNTPGPSQPLRGGFSLSVTLTNSNPSVGSVQTPVAIAGGADSAFSTFTPTAAGTTMITVQQPPNFGLSNQTTVQGTVTP